MGSQPFCLANVMVRLRGQDLDLGERYFGNRLNLPSYNKFLV